MAEEAITLLETKVIFPTHPLFDHDHVLHLSHIDNDRNIHLINFRYICVYTNTTTNRNDPVHVISQALSKALVYYYLFAGTLHHCSAIDSCLELFCAVGKSASLIYTKCDRPFNSVNYLDLPSDPLLDWLVPDLNPADSVLHPFMFQVTSFTCGGFSLGVSIHHSMCNGLGSTQFFNAMAELARGVIQISVELIWHRVSLLGPRHPSRVEVPFHEFLCLDKEFSPYSRKSCEIVRECFLVSDESVEQFKGEISLESGSSFTTFEELGAFIWRARYFENLKMRKGISVY